MSEIDRVIEKHGGWPKAFSPGPREKSHSTDCSCELSRFHEKDDTHSDFLAELAIILQDAHLPNPPNAALLNAISEAAVREIQPLADQHFGPGTVHVTCSDVKPGSIEINIVLTVCIAGAFQFFKDYDKIRSNVLLFSADVKQNCGKLRTTIKHLIDTHGPNSKH